MLLSYLMEKKPLTSSRVISSTKNFNFDENEHGTIKSFLGNSILSDTDKMAIKENQSVSNNYVYTIPVKPPIPTINRMKSMNEAKLAFLNSTVTSEAPITKKTSVKQEESNIYYAQIAITTESDDTRSTGGGNETLQVIPIKTKLTNNSNSVVAQHETEQHNMKKKIEPQHRKVSFKIKNTTTSYRRPTVATKTMTITGSKVSELTKKFNDLVAESHNGQIKQSKLARTIEDLQTASRCSANDSSTPSPTLSSSPNIKIVLRQRRGSKRRNPKKRCSSMDSIDKLIFTDNTSNKIRVIRSKSDGIKIPKSPKKRQKYQDSSEHPSGSDSVDGSPVKYKDDQSNRLNPTENNVVKNVIKKFECEIIAQTNSNNTLLRKNDKTKSTTPIKEKPKVPEKKSSLVLTKNLVVKDGVPKIKTIKPSVTEINPKEEIKEEKTTQIEIKKTDKSEEVKRKEQFYDRKKFKTNYIHSDKLPLKVVEIIQEDINEVKSTLDQEKCFADTSVIKDVEKTYQDITPNITPNDSFLWRRKSSTQIYSDSDKSISDSLYSFISVTMNEVTFTCPSESSDVVNEEEVVKIESQVSEPNNGMKNDTDSDFECNLIEAYNNEVRIGNNSNSVKEAVIEDDYEPLEPRNTDNVIIIPVKAIDRNSKLNCPLPEIPKETATESHVSVTANPTENIYQCLLEMRSHPEGDESSVHNYESCEKNLEERTRGDGDSDDGYEYCKPLIKPYCLTGSSGIQIAEDYRPNSSEINIKNYAISKSVSGASTVSYEKIGSERIYEKIPAHQSKLASKDSSPCYSSQHSTLSSDYTGYNDTDNIYYTIKHADGASISHFYESIPNSPSVVKLRKNLKRQLSSAVHKRLSFNGNDDDVSNISRSTMSSEQKTNSIYGQRSMISFNGQEIAFHVPSSETSVSDRSDRSDDWVDVSDEEKNEHQKIIILRERSRGRKSPISWSQKVRHQWHKTPKNPSDNKVFITSPSTVYIDTSAKCPYYSQNDEDARRFHCKKSDLIAKVKFIEILDETCLLNIRTVLKNGEFEIQDLIAFIECDSSDSGHVYELLEPAPAPHQPPPIDDDIDSFASSDSDFDDHDKTQSEAPPLPSSRLPSPPSGGQYTLTKIASAAHRKMRQIKRNLTKRYSAAMDKPFSKSQSNSTYDTPKTTKTQIYADHRPNIQNPYSNLDFHESRQKLNKTENPVTREIGFKEELVPREIGFKEELMTALSEKRLSNGDVPPPLPEKNAQKPSTPTESKKDSGTLSRKAYFSFKSPFRRPLSMAVDSSSEIPSALKITNSTFYLMDSMDGDSGFSNCSDSAQTGSMETLPKGRRRDGTRGPSAAESTPCLALQRPPEPPPPPPAPSHTDISAVNEELKRLLPSLSRKDKSPRTRSSWYADSGSDTISIATSNTSWYAEVGLVPAGHVSSSSGASSGSHPASPLPHSLFTHEPLYQFYNAAKVESVCHETGDSDSDAYETSPRAAPGEASAPAARPSAMALVAPRGPARTLWCEVPEVLNSTVLSSLAPAQKRLQEAKFELLTSEASYLNSLNVLETHFIAHPAFRDPHVLPREDWETLFATILPVRKCSQLLMNELEKCWQENILLTGICELVRRHAEQHFSVYVKYCAHQALMVRALQRLRDRPAFAAALKRMEAAPACQSLSLHSFLMLPMQRVTRLPLLMDAVLRHLPSADTEYQPCVRALATLNDFVSQCNEGARNTERVEEMFRLSQIIEFPPNMKDPPLLGPALNRRTRRPVRWLVRSGEMTQLVWKTDELKLTFGKKFHKVPLHLFLFNDLLVITKKKSEECYVAVDLCARSLLEVCDGEAGTAAARHALLLTLLENRDGRTLEMLMSVSSETEASRWSEALRPPAAGEGEAVYAGWDCPQVAALYHYRPAQPDELALAEGDVVNVTRKTAEGWYYGERTRDGEQGWFPGAYTAEIASAHVRARNLRQRYRLLALSATYLGQRRRP